MIKTKFPGVYYRASEGKRMNGRKPDVCFYYNYRRHGDLKWKKLGWESEGFSAKLAAQERNECVRCLRLGLPLPGERIEIPTFAVMFKQYLDLAKEDKSDLRNDQSRYKNHIKKALAKKKLDEVSPLDIERLKAELGKKGLAPATAKHCLVLIRQVINKAISLGKFKGPNPIRQVKLPTINNRRERFLSYAEADNLLKELAKVSESVHDQALISLHCGLRAGEIHNLRGQDLDFENGIIRIMNPKNRSARSAYMSRSVKEMLRKRLPENPPDLIFEDRWHGEPIKNVSKTFERSVDKLGLNKGVEDPRHRVVFHSLRHTFASWLALEGNSILTIKELLGHKTLAMTERYAHLTPDVKKRATLALEAAFDQSRSGGKIIPIAIAKEDPAKQ